MSQVRIAMVVLLGLTAAAAVQAAEPALAPTSPAVSENTPRPVTRLPARAPLDLRIGDIRRYMTPAEYRAAINAPDADEADIVVQAERSAPPLKSEQPIPVAIATPFWMLANPLKAWRGLVPDPNAPPPGPPAVVPQREFRWGP